MLLERKCLCGKITMTRVDRDQFKLWKSGTHIQDAFPDLNPFDREVLISGLCYKCQEDLFNRPAPGNEAQWGEIVGECDMCATHVYKIRNHVEGNTYKCGMCNAVLTVCDGTLVSMEDDSYEE